MHSKVVLFVNITHQALYGSSHIRSRWRKCVDVVVNYLGLPIGRLFVQKHFDEEAKSGVREPRTFKRRIFSGV